MTLTMGPGGNMMIGVLIRETNLSGFPRLFDVTFEQVYYQYGIFLNRTSIPLEQCSEKHFNFNEEMRA